MRNDRNEPATGCGAYELQAIKRVFVGCDPCGRARAGASPVLRPMDYPIILFIFISPSKSAGFSDGFRQGIVLIYEQDKRMQQSVTKDVLCSARPVLAT